MPPMEPIAAKDSTESSEAMSDPPRDRVRIVSTPGTCGGRPRIDGHRITVEDVAIWHERMGMSPDEIVSSYPTITLSDVQAAIAWYDENRQRIDDDIEEAIRFRRHSCQGTPGLRMSPYTDPRILNPRHLTLSGVTPLCSRPLF
jgi:uncharacterized protein (DUF433 family)